MTNTIAFPGLGIGPFTVSESFSFFGFTIHWYGVIIAFGIILAYLFARKKAKHRELSEDSLLDVLLFGLPSAIICARMLPVEVASSGPVSTFMPVVLAVNPIRKSSRIAPPRMCRTVNFLPSNSSRA